MEALHALTDEHTQLVVMRGLAARTASQAAHGGSAWLKASNSRSLDRVLRCISAATTARNGGARRYEAGDSRAASQSQTPCSEAGFGLERERAREDSNL